MKSRLRQKRCERMEGRVVAVDFGDEQTAVFLMRESSQRTPDGARGRGSRRLVVRNVRNDFARTPWDIRGKRAIDEHDERAHRTSRGPSSRLGDGLAATLGRRRTLRPLENRAVRVCGIRCREGHDFRFFGCVPQGAEQIERGR